MLHFSFSTVLMALLTSSLLVGLIAFVFLHSKTMVCAGYQLLGIFVGLAVIRMFFPFEFPFTVNLYLSPILSKIISFFQKPQIKILNTVVSFWNIFEAIWIVGIVFNLIRYVRHYRRARDYILKYGQEHTDNLNYKTILDFICAQHNRKNNFHVMELPNISIPFIFGLKNPYIILPVDLSITTDNLYYVLYHEAMHHFHHHLLIKGVIRILSIIYWWNPLFIVLYKQTNILLEMFIDGIITHKDTDVTSKYAECLLYMKKNSIKHASQISDFLKKESCLLMHSQDKDLKKRIDMLLQEFAKYKIVRAKIILTILMTGAYFASYVFILEANYQLPQFVEESLFIPNTNNSYFIQDDINRYEVYMNGIYFETVDSLEGYSNGIKIYNKKGELIHEN